MSNKPLIFMDPHPRTEPMIYTPEVSSELRKLARVKSHFGSRAPDEMVEAILPEVAIIVGQTAMPKERLERAPNLKAIINVKGNWEPNIDYMEADRRGIHVLTVAETMAPAVAEYCLAQAINLGRGFPDADRLFREHREEYGIKGNRDAYSLYGADVGIVGFGNLGRELVNLLEPFLCEISAYDPWVTDYEIQEYRVYPTPLIDVIETSKFLFLLAGVTTENVGFLDRDLLSRIQEDACVVLASRAEIVDFDAFLSLAASGRFRAAIDVFPEEPVPPSSKARTTPNVLFTAHLAGGIQESYFDMQQMMVCDIRNILTGSPPLFLRPADPVRAGMMRSP